MTNLSKIPIRHKKALYLGGIGTMFTMHVWLSPINSCTTAAFFNNSQANKLILMNVLRNIGWCFSFSYCLVPLWLFRKTTIEKIKK